LKPTATATDRRGERGGTTRARSAAHGSLHRTHKDFEGVAGEGRCTSAWRSTQRAVLRVLRQAPRLRVDLLGKVRLLEPINDSHPLNVPADRCRAVRAGPATSQYEVRSSTAVPCLSAEVAQQPTTYQRRTLRSASRNAGFLHRASAASAFVRLSPPRSPPSNRGRRAASAPADPCRSPRAP